MIFCKNPIRFYTKGYSVLFTRCINLTTFQIDLTTDGENFMSSQNTKILLDQK